MIINSNINSICRNEVLSSKFVKHFVKHWAEITIFCLKNPSFLPPNSLLSLEKLEYYIEGRDLVNKKHYYYNYLNNSIIKQKKQPIY